jgi:hypothetical protein
MDTQVLVARAQDGDSEAFGQLYDLFGPEFTTISTII